MTHNDLLQKDRLISAPFPTGLAVHRLTALWALNEAGLGGILHAVRSPFTGILVGAIAILLISLIALFAERKAVAILKATVIVLVIKATVSPYSPFPAYLAVSFQGLLGAVLFGWIADRRLAAYLLAILGMAQTGVQKIIVTTLIYGFSLWESIDLFVNYVLQLFPFAAGAVDFRASVWLIGFYIGTHLVAGILIGRYACLLPVKVTAALADWSGDDRRATGDEGKTAERRPAARRRKWGRILGLVLLIAMAFILFAPAMSGYARGLYVILRTLVVLLTWYFFLAPLMTRLLQGFLNRKRSRYQGEIGAVLQFLPFLQQQARILWCASAGERICRRWPRFLINLIALSLTMHMGADYPAGAQAKTEAPDEKVHS